MNAVRWGCEGRAWQLRHWREHAGSAPQDVLRVATCRWTDVPVRGREQVRDAMGSGTASLRAMRQMLALERDCDVSRLTDHAVLERVVTKLCRRELVLLRQEPCGIGGAAVAATTRAVDAGVHDDGIDWSPRRPEASPRRATAEPAPDPRPEPTQLPGGQAARAAALRLAAAAGLPFCEECMRWETTHA